MCRKYGVRQTRPYRRWTTGEEFRLLADYRAGIPTDDILFKWNLSRKDLSNRLYLATRRLGQNSKIRKTGPKEKPPTAG